jgi:hypothetical protein
MIENLQKKGKTYGKTGNTEFCVYEKDQESPGKTGQCACSRRDYGKG